MQNNTKPFFALMYWY